MKQIANQHGDLLIEVVSEMPAGSAVDARKGYVLEKGEGVHTHTLEDVEGVTIVESCGDTYVRVTKPTRINHEEHGFQTLHPGIYKKRIERVWDYETEEARRTLD